MADLRFDARWCMLRARTSEPRTDANGSSLRPGPPGGPPLLKNPTSNLATNGGSQHPAKRKQGGHSPNLADEVEWLLPTPAAIDKIKRSPNQHHGNEAAALSSAAQLSHPSGAECMRTRRGRNGPGEWRCAATGHPRPADPRPNLAALPPPHTALTCAFYTKSPASPSPVFSGTSTPHTFTPRGIDV